MRKFGRLRDMRRACVVALSASFLQSAAWAQPAPKGLAAYSSLLTSGFFVLLAAFVGLVIWEVLDNKKASRSSLDIAKLAAAAAKKQSSAGAPSGSLASMEVPSTNRPFAPPPPPPPAPQAPSEPKEAAVSPFSSAVAPSESSNPFAPVSRNQAQDSPASLESTVAFNPSGGDAGSSGGWADLLQRVRAGEPESGGFPAPSAPPATEEDVYPDQTLAAPPPPATASSSEAWEALLKRTTTGENPVAPKAPVGDVGKISLSSNFGSAEAPAPPGFAPSAPAPNIFGEETAKPPAAGSSFSLPSAAPPAAEPPLGLGFSFSPEPSGEASSPFSLPSTPAPAPGGFESSFKLPGSDDSGGFQLPGGNAPFDFGASDGSSTSTLPLSDLFASKSPPASPPAFQLPSGSGGADPFGLADDGGVGRTIPLDFARGGGQKPPPPLPKTEG